MKSTPEEIRTTCPACSSKAVRHLPGSVTVNACFDCGTEFEVRETWGGPVANVLGNSDHGMPTPATPTPSKPMTNVEREFVALLRESVDTYRAMHGLSGPVANVEPLLAPGYPKPTVPDGPLLPPSTFPTPPPPVKRRTLTPAKELVNNIVTPLPLPKMNFNRRG